MIATFPTFLAPRDGETFIDYWMSLSPAAPLFGVEWRFSELFWRALPPEAPEAASEAVARIVEPVEDAVVVVDEAITDVADDLTKLKGVGPKLAAELAELGLTSFAQLAEMTEQDIAELSAKLSSFRDRPVRDDWVGQARALMGLTD